MQQTTHSAMRDYGLAVNPHLGLSLGLREFDETLLRGDPERTEVLIKDLEEVENLFSPEEFDFVKSRRAALFLCQGIRFRLRADPERARICYEEGRRIQQTLKSPKGEGQFIAALYELNNPVVQEELLKGLSSKPAVVGDSESLLIGRLKTLPPNEQMNIILSARICQSWRTLQEGLQIHNPYIVSLTVMAMGEMNPGPDYPLLFQMLNSPAWIVRWQALALLSKHIVRPEERAAHRQEIHENIQLLLANNENDPLVLCEMLRLLQQIGSADDTPFLLTMLDELDQDVLLATIQTLGNIGDDRAIPHLLELQRNSAYIDKDLSHKIDQALQMMKARSYPAQEPNAARKPSISVKGQRTASKTAKPFFRIIQRRNSSG